MKMTMINSGLNGLNNTDMPYWTALNPNESGCWLPLPLLLKCVFFFFLFICQQHEKNNYNLHVSHNHQKTVKKIVKNSKKLMAGTPETDIIQYMCRIIYTSLVVHNVYINLIKYSNNYNNEINNKLQFTGLIMAGCTYTCNICMSPTKNIYYSHRNHIIN